MFGIRIAILLFFDFFVTTNIASVDFFAVFIGAFTILPISLTIGNRNNDISNNLNNITNEGTNFENSKDTSPVVLIDPNYLSNEKMLLRSIIEGEIESQGENPKKLSTSKLNIKRNILLLMFTFFTFICTMMFFFNIPLIICLICEGILFLIYRLIGKKYNIINVLSKQAKNNPNEDISNIVANIKNNKKDVIVPNMMKTCISVIVAVLIPIAVFSNPKILYIRYGSGYAVLKYTKGLNEQDTDIIIPDTYKGKDVVAIGTGAFSKTNIKSIRLPKKLESIKSEAFYGCASLTNIILPETMEEIRASAFEDCLNLRSINLPDRITKIRAKAFKNDRYLTDVQLPNSLEYLGAGAFSHCASIKEITIPRNVTEINGQTFEYCTSLRTINLHNNIISIHGETFTGDSALDNVILPSEIKEIRGNTFEGCSSLTSINIPEGVTRIGGHAFYGCSKLKSVYVPTTVKEIGSSAFRRCYNLRNITIPRNAVINERAFKESPTSISYY